METFIQSNNDWDILRKVIVGRIDNAHVPSSELQYNIKINGETFLHENILTAKPTPKP